MTDSWAHQHMSFSVRQSAVVSGSLNTAFGKQGKAYLASSPQKLLLEQAAQETLKIPCSDGDYIGYRLHL